MVKTRISLKNQADIPELLQQVKMYFAGYTLNEQDGIRIDDMNGWLHIRKSNTEPIVRIIAEGNSKNVADEMIKKVMEVIKPFAS
jgi:phosphomannomutase